MKIGLCLGGGGPRGYAHLGVIQALTEAGVHFDLINGSSIGAVVGAAYALHLDVDAVGELAMRAIQAVKVRALSVLTFPRERQSFLHNWLTSALCGVATMRQSVQSHRANRRALSILFGEKTFADCRIPFSAVATDLATGETVSVNEGKLVDGVLPSISLPGVFPPVRYGQQLLVDGFLLANIPVRQVRAQGADFVISVELAVPRELGYRNGLELINYIESLKQKRVDEWQTGDSDFNIPVRFGSYHPAERAQYKEAIERGYVTATQLLPQLLRKLKRRG